MIASHTVPKASGYQDMVPGQDFEKYINAHLFTIQEQLFWGTQWPNPEIETPDPKEFIRKCREGML